MEPYDPPEDGGDFGFMVPDQALHLPMDTVMKAAGITLYMHSTAFNHTLIMLGEPSHECQSMTGEQIIESNAEKPEVTWDDVRALLAYESSMLLAIRSMKNYMATQGFPFFDDEEVHER